VTEYFL
jgi:2-oxoisovalerate dehydrogenase E1 component beta subunit